MVEDWKKSTDEGHTAEILSTDMSKAFDSLHPAFLLAKLKAYGLSEEALGLLGSYFRDRKNGIKLGHVASNWKEIPTGCPRGSSLGPLLRNVFQNDILNLCA